MEHFFASGRFYECPRAFSRAVFISLLYDSFWLRAVVNSIYLLVARGSSIVYFDPGTR